MTQATALKILQTGASVFLTGEPGSGKTHTVNQYVRWLRARGVEPAITASTGIAATHIGGMTIHSWSGIGIRKNLPPYELDAIASNERVAKRILGTSVLIIDEISMLSADTFAMAEMVVREVRRNKSAFGGLQVVLVGDFFQLPPVITHSENINTQLDFGDGSNPDNVSSFAFRSHAWSALNPLVCYISEQHRQDDAQFLELLARVRSGNADANTHTTLETRRIHERDAPNELPRLYSHNIDVDRVNLNRLHAIAGHAKGFTMATRGPDTLVATLKRGCLSPEELVLKIGAKVMFTKNNPDGSFVNGTLGTVEKFNDAGFPVVRTLRGRRISAEPMEWTITDGSRVLAKIAQIPLRLAWAITVHKSQGMTLDAAVMDLSTAFEYGQGYVALSRVRALDGLHLIGWNDRALEVHPEVSAQDRDFKLRSADARAAFESMPETEHKVLSHNFVRSAGGKPEGGIITKTVGGKTKPRGATLDTTLALLQNGKTVAEIAEARGLTKSTIFSHIVSLYEAGRISRKELEPLVSANLKRSLPKIHTLFKELGIEHLTPVFEKLRGVHSYDDLRLARLLMD